MSATFTLGYRREQVQLELPLEFRNTIEDSGEEIEVDDEDDGWDWNARLLAAEEWNDYQDER